MSEKNDPNERMRICQGMLVLSDKLATMADEMDVLIQAYAANRWGDIKPPLPENPISAAYLGTLELMGDVRTGQCRVLSREAFNRQLRECPESIE